MILPSRVVRALFGMFCLWCAVWMGEGLNGGSYIQG